MKNTKLTFYLLVMITAVATSQRSGKILFRDSSEFDSDERTVTTQRNRNHRERTSSYPTQNFLTEFEQNLPGVYPIKGPPQAPLVFSNTQPVYTTQPNTNNQPQQQPLHNPYPDNPFLSKVTADTNKYNPVNSSGITNQRNSSVKPLTTTPSYSNPRRTNLLYGSNLLENEVSHTEKAETTTDISFGDRGIFDTAPHCQSGYILVNNKCRLQV